MALFTLLTFLSKSRKVSTTNTIFYIFSTLGLAIFDNLVLILTILQDGIDYWFIGTTSDLAVYHPITSPLFAFAFGGNGFLTVLICIERFVMIMYTEKSKIWCSKQKTIIYICVASLTSLLGSIPEFFSISWDENGKVKPTEFASIVAGLRLLTIFVMTTIMLTLSIIIAIKVSLQFLNIR